MQHETTSIKFKKKKKKLLPSSHKLFGNPTLKHNKASLREEKDEKNEKHKMAYNFKHGKIIHGKTTRCDQLYSTIVQKDKIASLIWMLPSK